MHFTLPELKYPYDALEPHIDARTMEIHHSKHHQGYTNNLNAALKEVYDKAINPDIPIKDIPSLSLIMQAAKTQGKNIDIEDIHLEMDMTNMALRNNAGGYFNHCLFWEIMNPNKENIMSDGLKSAIDEAFGSFDAFKDIFAKAAATRFGSGWAWLCVKDGKLDVCSTPNQDNPLMPNGCGGTPILGLDVWEHAYYLNYQNRRPDYINAFFEVINWGVVSEKFNKAL